MKFTASLLSLLSLSLAPQCLAFAPVINSRPSSSSCLSAIVSMELEKPLGIILEEVEENAAKGVLVEELSDAGSAYASTYASKLVGSQVTSVMGTDVTAMDFDSVMEVIIDAPSPVSIAFDIEGENEEGGEAATATPQLEIGTAVQIKVIQDGNDDKVIDAKVGDNLRKTLLDNNVELYRGLKKKLGNCGGGGQCTFCAVDFVENECESWAPRSEYEDGKIAKFPTARLACLNNIQGPATIRVQ